MPELRPMPLAVVTCLADTSAVEAVLHLRPGAAFRIAPDEAMLLGGPEEAAQVASTALAAAKAADPDALVVDASDGWAGWVIEGEGAAEAFARLSHVPLPGSGFAQGEVAHVPARIVSGTERIRLLVPAMFAEAVRERVLADCASLGMRERAEPRPWGAEP